MIEQYFKNKNRIKEIDLISEPILTEKELLRKENIKYSNYYSNVEFMKSKFKKFAEDQKDIPQKYVDIINKNFWDMI